MAQRFYTDIDMHSSGLWSADPETIFSAEGRSSESPKLEFKSDGRLFVNGVDVMEELAALRREVEELKEFKAVLLGLDEA